MLVGEAGMEREKGKRCAREIERRDRNTNLNKINQNYLGNATSFLDGTEKPYPKHRTLHLEKSVVVGSKHAPPVVNVHT